ncbi:MAG: DUF1934 domain-containing protein [Clostridia bacterium]|nr:DUF1934 domain-containing protein [Clostridia bacterium]
MDDKYIISVIGTQSFEEDEDTIELTTSASYIERNGKKFIKYREYDPDNNNVYVSNVIKIESKDKITLVKNGGNRYSQLILECGKRHQCMYSSSIGSMSIGIYTETIAYDVDENGGKIEIDYTIDFNSDFQSDNHMLIILRKKGDTENV